MSITFTKLFSSITASTVWCTDPETKVVWITLLAMADKNGRIWGSVPGIAGIARVPVESCRRALDSFLGPDPDSRTKDHEGRRIEPIDGGWKLLNYAKYRALRDEEERKEYKREWIANKRSVDKPVDSVDKSRPSYTNAEAEAEADNKDISTSSTAIVFDHWKKTFNHPRSVLDAKRTRIIKAALKLYPPELICRSLSGYSFSRWHMGENDRKAIFDGIDLLLRDAEHVEKGIEFFDNPKKEGEKQKWI